MDWGSLHLDADRWTAFSETWTFEGEDFTGAAFAAEIRLYPDATGAPLVALATVGTASAEGLNLIYAGTDTVANHIAAGRIDEVPPTMTPDDILPLSILGCRVNEATMEALPYPAERGDDAALAWDLHVTPSGGLKKKYLGGKFTVLAGVTH